MPQMAPMYWLILFFYFLLVFLLFLVNTYYFSMPQLSVSGKSSFKIIDSFNWMW